MAILLAITLVTLCSWYVFLPIVQVQSIRRQAEINEAMYLAKLKLVRNYYPTLSRFTYTEIARLYDIDTLYDNIGRGRR